MAWKENLFQNLLTVAILLGLALMIYSRLSRKTLKEIILEIREAFSVPIEQYE